MSLRPHSPQIYLIQINSFNILNSDMLKSTLFSSYSEISMKNNITLTMASEISKYNLFHSLFKKKKKNDDVFGVLENHNFARIEFANISLFFFFV